MFVYQVAEKFSKLPQEIAALPMTAIRDLSRYCNYEAQAFEYDRERDKARGAAQAALDQNLRR